MGLEKPDSGEFKVGETVKLGYIDQAHTAIDPENVPHNLYAFKEAFDDLRRRSPGDSGGEQIVVTTHVDTDNDGNELEQYLHASHCEGAAWDACLAKDVIFGSAIGEEKALAQILWHMTFWGFTPGHEGFRDDTPSNIFERKQRNLNADSFSITQKESQIHSR